MGEAVEIFTYGDDNEGAEIKLKKNTRAPQPEYM